MILNCGRLCDINRRKDWGIVSMRKIMKNAIYIFVFLLLGLSTALLTHLHFFSSGDSDLSGEWTAQLDMTQQAAVMAFDWLQDIEGVSVSLEDMESYMQGLTIQVNLTMEQKDRLTGTFRCNIQAASYDVCKQEAYEAFAGSFRELLGERLHMAGYGGSTEQEAVETLVAEAFGMSTVSYLMSCCPALLPSLEELQAKYDGSGTYETADDILIRRFEDGGAVITKEEHYIRKDASLILTGEGDSGDSGRFFSRYPIIYTCKPQDE